MQHIDAEKPQQPRGSRDVARVVVRAIESMMTSTTHDIANLIAGKLPSERGKLVRVAELADLRMRYSS